MVMAIGYVTSGKYNDFGPRFEAGLTSTGNPPWVVGTNVNIKKGQAEGDYDSQGVKQTLKRHVVRLSNDPDVRLIVAVGGLVSAFAAAKWSQKPFLVIIGQVPEAGDFELDPESVPNFCGGINLATVATNDLRNAKIAFKAGCKPEEVCLIVNDNARMAKAEKRVWKAYGWPALSGGRDIDGDNDKEDFLRVFNKAKKKGYKAVVLSSDPFFAQQRNDLVSAANAVGGAGPAFQLRFCYPARYFAGATPVPTAGRDMWLGPDLDEAYRLVGVKAGDLLTKLKNAPADFMGLDTLMSGDGNIP